MNCQKCNEPVEDGAAFCGNCGQSLAAPALSEVPNIAPTPIPNSQPPIQQPVLTPQPPVQQNPITANVTPPPSVSAKPAYAIANPASHRGDVKALLSLLFGIIGLVGCFVYGCFRSSIWSSWISYGYYVAKITQKKF